MPGGRGGAGSGGAAGAPRAPWPRGGGRNRRPPSPRGGGAGLPGPRVGARGWVLRMGGAAAAELPTARAGRQTQNPGLLAVGAAAQLAASGLGWPRVTAWDRGRLLSAEFRVGRRRSRAAFWAPPV